MVKVYEGVGVIEAVLGNNNYQVAIGEGDVAHSVLCHLSGKMRRFKINVITGDEVTVTVPPPYDRGRITFRGRKEERPTTTGRQKRTKERKRPKGRGARR